MIEIAEDTERKAEVVILDAIIREPLIPEHSGNDRINCLPAKLFDTEAFARSFACTPNFSTKERSLSKAARILSVGKLSLYTHLMSNHVEVLEAIPRVIAQGYMRRPPVKMRQQDGHKHYKTSMAGKLVPIVPMKPGHAEWFGIYGTSGTGKTVAVNRALSFVPQVVRHRSGIGSRFQVVWLKVDCPPNGSLKQMCRWIVAEFDHILGTKHEDEVGKRATTEELMNSVAALCVRYHTGLIVVDEIQNVIKAVNRAGDSAIDFFLTFSNVVQVPVFTIGNPKALQLFSKIFRVSRRICDQGVSIFRRLIFGDEWKLFMDEMFEYQWVTHPVKAKDFYQVMYDLSQGVPAVVIRLFQLTQISAIRTGKETITENLLREVVKERFSPIAPMLAALRSNNTKKILEFDDLLAETLNSAANAVDTAGKRAVIDAAAATKRINAVENSAVSTIVSLDVPQLAASNAVSQVLFENPGASVATTVRLALELIGTESQAQRTSPPTVEPLSTVVSERHRNGRGVKSALLDKGLTALNARGGRHERAA
ncbi:MULTISPECIES: ATP-binding protein [Caballeronia]|uniref:ATP-binding protein n=1 Tax=Caballeronia jiangsuensis TaxID=1458357 RepID=A0ABW9CCW9_9BURK|nr:ATP-binding protein [Caballeronia sp. GaOx3]